MAKSNFLSRTLNYAEKLSKGVFAESVPSAKGGFKRVLQANNAVKPAPAMAENVLGFLETASRYYHGEGEYGLTDALADSFLNSSKKITYGESLMNTGVKDFKNYTSDELGKEVYDLSSKNIRYGKIAASGFGVMAGISAASGLIHDSNGNTDLAGIPFI